MTGRVRFVAYFLFFVVAFLIKFHHFNAPPFDKHNFRQTQTLSTIEDYYENGVNLMMPKTHYVGNPGYHVLEFPVYQAFMAGLWKVTSPGPGMVRVVNIIAGLLSALLIFLITRRFLRVEEAILSSVFFILSPLNMIYHRSMLIDTWAVLFMLFTLYLYLAQEPKTKGKLFLRWFLFTASIILAALIKALYLFPFVVIFLLTFRKKPARSQILYWSGIVIALILLGLWMIHAREVNSFGYFTSTQSIERHIGFKDFATLSFWMAMIFRTVTRFAPGTGMFLLLVSLVLCFYRFSDKEEVVAGTFYTLPLKSLFKILWVILLLYLLTFAAMNRIHDYYQMVLIPFMSVLLALSCGAVLREVKQDLLRDVLAITFVAGFAIPSYVFFMFYSAPVPKILMFRERIAPLVESSNKFVFLFYKQSPYGGSFELFPKVASMYSINKWGRYFEIKNTEQVISILKKLPESVRQSSGELILYDLPPLSKEEKSDLSAMGFELFRENSYGQVFKLTGRPVVNPYPSS